MVEQANNPTLTMIYLPHLDYTLQKHGPEDKVQLPADLRAIDAIVERLVRFYEDQCGARIILLSEYGYSSSPPS